MTLKAGHIRKNAVFLLKKLKTQKALEKKREWKSEDKTKISNYYNLFLPRFLF